MYTYIYMVVVTICIAYLLIFRIYEKPVAAGYGKYNFCCSTIAYLTRSSIAPEWHMFDSYRKTINIFLAMFLPGRTFLCALHSAIAYQLIIAIVVRSPLYFQCMSEDLHGNPEADSAHFMTILVQCLALLEKLPEATEVIKYTSRVFRRHDSVLLI